MILRSLYVIQHAVFGESSFKPFYICKNFKSYYDMSEDVIKYAIEQGIKLGIAAYRNEAEKKRKDPTILVQKCKAEKMVGGRLVLKALEKRGCIFPYQFGVEEMLDEDGEPVKMAQGRIYYRLCEIEKAIEDGNLLKNLRAFKPFK